MSGHNNKLSIITCLISLADWLVAVRYYIYIYIILKSLKKGHSYCLGGYCSFSCAGSAAKQLFIHLPERLVRVEMTERQHECENIHLEWQ